MSEHIAAVEIPDTRLVTEATELVRELDSARSCPHSLKQEPAQCIAHEPMADLIDGPALAGHRYHTVTFPRLRPGLTAAGGIALSCPTSVVLITGGGDWMRMGIFTRPPRPL
jgi:hypothetical protein